MYSDSNYTTTFGKKKRNKDNTGPDMKDLEVAPVPEAPEPKTPPKKGGTYTAPSDDVAADKVKNWSDKFGGAEGLQAKASAAKNIGSILSSGQMKSLPSTDPVRGGSSKNTVPGEEISDYDAWVRKEKKKNSNNYA